MRGIDPSNVIVAVAAGFLGGLFIVASSYFFQAGAQLCADTDKSCAMEWAAVISAAFTTLIALGTAVVLIQTLGAQKKSAMQELRAYVYLTEAKIADDQSGIVYSYKNFGLTPAYDLRFLSGYSICDPGEFKPAEINEAVDLTQRDLAPSQGLRASTGASPNFTEEFARQLLQLRSGAKVMFCYGRMEYRDAFDRRRGTHFRFQLRVNPASGNLLYHLALSAEGNHST